MKNINWNQVKTIIKYSTVMELTGKALRRPDKRTYRVLISLAVVYVFSGILLGIISSGIADNFTAAFICSTYFMVIIGSYILLEYPALVTGPEDFDFYSAKPVTAGTYFLGKMLSVVCVISLFFLIFIIPYGVVFLMLKRAPGLLLINCFAVYTGAVLITLVIINLYGLLVKYVPARVVSFAASILQIVITFASYALYIFAADFIRQSAYLRIELSPWLLLVPSAWGAAVYEITTNILAVPAFALIPAAVIALLVLAVRVVSLDYASKIAEYSLKSGKTTRKIKDHSVIWQSPEAYAVSRLIINHFKYNAQFRTGILMIIPITVLYFFIAIYSNNAAILDPFTQAGRDTFFKTFLLYMAIGFFPVFIKSTLSYSSESEASWLFFTSPADRIKLVSASKQFILLFFLAPYLLIFAIVFFFFTGALLHTLMHFLVIFILSLILLNVFIYFFAEIPFSKTIRKGQRTAQMYLRLVIALLLPLPLQLFVLFFYAALPSYMLLVAGLITCHVFVEILGKKFAAGKLEKMEYTD